MKVIYPFVDTGKKKKSKSFVDSEKKKKPKQERNSHIICVHLKCKKTYYDKFNVASDINYPPILWVIIIIS